MDSGRVTIEERPVTSGYELPKPSRKVILGLMVALVLYVLVRNVAAAMTRPIWCDEVLTMLVASQPNLRAMWTALMRGVDSHPPPFLSDRESRSAHRPQPAHCRALARDSGLSVYSDLCIRLR